MNEMIEPVGFNGIAYYNNYSDAFAQNGNYIALTPTYVIGTDITFGSIGSYTSWRVANWYSGSGPLPPGVYNNGYDLSIFSASTYFIYPANPCFLEGSKILCKIDSIDTYVPVENMKAGMLVKTSNSGYKKVEIISKGTIQNPGNDDRTENRLYRCPVQNYPELKEDLYITGCHSILVDDLTDVQKSKTIQQLGEVFVTEKKYRLMACIDEKAQPWNSEGTYNIWHFGLENSNERRNYGVYANGGLLVETCSLFFLRNKSNMNVV